MSWQLASFALVVGALVACFAWYERSHPSSKVVALVATMAALTALGRDAFAALPDVKPTTVMVFVCGYAFGGGPGLAVGAVGALTSNLLLGEGPWTPWQMLAWGLVGIGGAVVGAITGRRLRRVSLALACALAAVAFNLIMDAYTWTLSGAHTLTAYVAVLAAALTFDLTHVAASFGFGLAFGPALARMLDRARVRLSVNWRPLGVVPVVLVVIAGGAGVTAGALSLIGPVRASAAAPGPVAAAVAYLRRAQNSDGGFGSDPGQSSSEEFDAWTAMGLAAVGVDPRTVSRGGHTVVDALRAGAAQVNGAGDLERTILALHAAGQSPGSLGGRDLVRELLAQRSPDGSFQQLSNSTAFAVFALLAAGRSSHDPVVRSAGRWLSGQQNSDGGFGFGPRGGASDVDDTAAVLQGLIDSATPGPGVGRAVDFLRHAQNGDGGFPLVPGARSDAQSTAWVVQAFAAAGVNGSNVRRGGGPGPLDYLRAAISPDGSVRYSTASSQTPVWVTAQALAAFGAKPFPIGPTAPGAGATVGLAAAGSSRASVVSAGSVAAAGTHTRRVAGQPVRHPPAVSKGRRPPSATVAQRAAALRQRVNQLARASGALAGVLLGRLLG